MVYEAGSLGVICAVAAIAVIARRWAAARDIALSAAVAAAASGALVALLGGRGGRPGSRSAATR